MKIETIRLQNDWQQFNLMNDNGMVVRLLNFGGIITEILAPDKDVNFENVVLGYNDYQDYETDTNFFGAIIGPVAGRVENANFSLNSNKYLLEKNDGENHLHGGTNGFHRVIWDAEPFQTDDAVGVKLNHKSKDGEDGYPGNINVTVTYTLNNANQLILDYSATTDKLTYLTLTNHSYFNLSGNLKDTIHNHYVTIDSHQIAELNEGLIPTGKIINTTNSPFDFGNGRTLNDGIISDARQNKIAGNGCDHYFIFDHNKKKQVTAEDASSGRVLTIEADQPGMVMYTANNLDNGLELSEGVSKKHAGVCFETQGSPASIHHEGFPSIILYADETYKKQTVFTFGVTN